jgi:hypothetical protein
MAYASYRYRWGLGEPRLTEAQHREGAERWYEYDEAQHNERRQRDLAQAERDEAMSKAIIDFLRRNPD